MTWRKVKVREFLTERPGRFSPDEANALGLQRVGKIDFSGKIHLVADKSTRTGMILVKKGDLLISGINAEKGAVAIYDFEEDALATIHYSSYTYDARKINITFLKWFLKSPAFKGILNSNVGSGIKTEIKPKRFLALEMYLPELEEQAKIVNHIQAIEGEIAELQSLAQGNESLVTALRQAILTEAVQGRLTARWHRDNPAPEHARELLHRIAAEKARLIREKKIGKEKPLPPVTEKDVPYAVPEGWVWCYMQDLCPGISSGSTPPSQHWTKSGIPYLKVYNIRDQKIDFAYKEQFIDPAYHLTKSKRSILKPGDVVMNIVGPPLGKVAIIPSDYDEWNCNQAISFFKPVVLDLNVWIYTFLCEGSFLKDIELIGTAGQDNISVTKCKNIKIPLPPLSEQHAIVQKVSTLLAYCDELEQQVRQSRSDLEVLMQAVLGEVFGGRGHEGAGQMPGLPANKT